MEPHTHPKRLFSIVKGVTTMTIKVLLLAGVAGAAILAAVPFSPTPVLAQTNTYVAPQEGQSGDEQSSQEMKKRKQGQTSGDQSAGEMKKKRGEGQTSDDQSSREMEKDRKEATVDRGDRRRGERRRSREGKFRYFHEGYYYATPWWTTGVVVDGGGIDCREGARIVSRRGFNRVSPISCGGEVYSYRGWRGGDPWRVRIDSDTGRIVSVRPAG
jgi:hypothetical protein